MSIEPDVTGVPVTERAFVGLCHDLNDQLAAVSAYTFLLKRRGLLGEVDGPLQERLDQIAQSVRLVRSLCRDPQIKRAPVAVSLLADAMTDILRSHPEGAIACHARASDEDGSGVVRCEWASTLRSLLVAAAWVRRGVPVEERVEVSLALGTDRNTLVVAMGATETPPPETPIHPDPVARGVTLESTGPREVTVRLPLEE